VFTDQFDAPWGLYCLQMRVPEPVLSGVEGPLQSEDEVSKVIKFIFRSELAITFQVRSFELSALHTV